MRYKNIIWDFDGTLFDTYPAMTKCLVAALEEMGVRAVYDEAHALLKRSMGEARRYYAENFGLDLSELQMRYSEISRQERYGPHASPPFPYIREILEKSIPINTTIS